MIERLARKAGALLIALNLPIPQWDLIMRSIKNITTENYLPDPIIVRFLIKFQAYICQCPKFWGSHYCVFIARDLTFKKNHHTTGSVKYYGVLYAMRRIIISEIRPIILSNGNRSAILRGPSLHQQFRRCPIPKF